MTDSTPTSPPHRPVAPVSASGGNSSSPMQTTVVTSHQPTAPRRPPAYNAKRRLRLAIRDRRRRRHIALASGLAWTTPPIPSVSLPSPPRRGTKRSADRHPDDSTDSEFVQAPSSSSLLFAPFTPPSSPPPPKRRRTHVAVRDRTVASRMSPSLHRQWRSMRFEERRRQMERDMGTTLRPHHCQDGAAAASESAVTPTAMETEGSPSVQHEADGRRSVSRAEQRPWTYRVYLQPLPADAVGDVCDASEEGGTWKKSPVPCFPRGRKEDELMSRSETGEYEGRQPGQTVCTVRAGLRTADRTYLFFPMVLRPTEELGALYYAQRDSLCVEVRNE